MSKDVRGRLKTVAAAAAKLGKSLLNVTKSILKIGTALAGVSFAALAVGVKKALDLGGALSDLATRTGIAVKELTILQQAFRDNGKSAEDVGPVINKMQKAITDLGNGLSTQVRAFDALGISFEQIKDMAPEQQFRLLQERLSALESPTQRAGVAMDILGRSGGELLTLFSDTGAFQKAAVTIGGQAELLEKNAATFDRASDILNSTGVKIRGFFVGVADKVQGTLLPLLERWNKLDFTGAGEAFGEKLRKVMDTAIERAGRIFETVRNAFQAGNLGEVVGLSIEIGLLKAADSFAERMAKIVSTIATGLSNPLVIDAIGESANAAMASAFNAVGSPIAEKFNESPVGKLTRHFFGEKDVEPTSRFETEDNPDRVSSAILKVFSGGDAPGVKVAELGDRLDKLLKQNEKRFAERNGGGNGSRAMQPIDHFNAAIQSAPAFPHTAKAEGEAGTPRFGFGAEAAQRAKPILRPHRAHFGNGFSEGDRRSANRFGFNAGNDDASRFPGLTRLAEMQKRTPAPAMFPGLDRLNAMQTGLATNIAPGIAALPVAGGGINVPGVGPGGAGVGLQGAKALAGATGLQGAVGGLGAVRKVGKQQDEQKQKKEETLGTTNAELKQANELLQQQNDMLRDALTVS